MLIDIESDVMYEVKRLPYKKISTFNGQYLAQRINNDSVTISDCVVEKLPYAAIEILKIIVLIPILFSINTLLGFLSLLIVSIYVLFYKLSQARYYLTEIKRNKIIIVISHDPSLSKIADKIIKFPVNQGIF